MLATIFERSPEPANDQLLRLYWNRAGVKRELSSLKRERYELLDKLKEQEGAIVRAQEQLEGLERLLTNPLAAANAMVYFQLRHLWRVGGLRLEQFAQELHQQREKRERAQLHEAALAKRKRRLSAIDEKLNGLAHKRKDLIEECLQLEQRLNRMNFLVKIVSGRGMRTQIASLKSGRQVIEQRIEELNELVEKIQGEPLPEPEGLSLESRRLINLAIIALAQHLVVHFSEHDLATLAKTAMQRPVTEMKFGDRRTCDQMVERIREKIEELRQDKGLADQVKRRTDALINEVKYRNDNDTVPRPECVPEIATVLSTAGGEPERLRRASDAPLRANVVEDDYWDLIGVLR